MQTHPANWAALLTGSYIVEYKYIINGVEYTGNNIQGTPAVPQVLPRV